MSDKPEIEMVPVLYKPKSAADTSLRQEWISLATDAFSVDRLEAQLCQRRGAWLEFKAARLVIKKQRIGFQRMQVVALPLPCRKRRFVWKEPRCTFCCIRRKVNVVVKGCVIVIKPITLRKQWRVCTAWKVQNVFCPRESSNYLRPSGIPTFVAASNDALRIGIYFCNDVVTRTVVSSAVEVNTCGHHLLDNVVGNGHAGNLPFFKNNFGCQDFSFQWAAHVMILI